MYPDKRHEYVANKEAWENAHPKGVGGGFIDYEPYSAEERCMSPEHKPPGMIVLPPGRHTYQCPSCRKVTVFTVPLVTL